jgi:hypothetical protein
MDTPDNMLTDHKDFNGLNCQRNNLRNCTKSQNQMNKKSRGASNYLGVHYQYWKDSKYITASIRLKRDCFYLGIFKTEEAAARAYDVKAKELFGEFANLNFK